MIILPASDRSLQIFFGNEISPDSYNEVARLTERLQRQRGILNLHPAYASLLIDFDPRLRSHDQIESLIRDCLAEPHDSAEGPHRVVEIPVQYGGELGPDLEDVARHTGLSAERVVELFSTAEYLVYFVGFSTCFPYLGGLPPELATPRLSAPRKHVPEGSVAIGGAQAGVYPIASPGGWRLIGRTSLRLFDPNGAPPPLLRMGDHVRFVAHRAEPVAEVRSDSPAPAPPTATGGHIRVVSPGFLTTVQDLGRFGWTHFGVSASGAADPLALRAGNLLVGNPDNAAALEMTLVGGAFEFERDTTIAFTGSDFGADLPLWTPVEVKAGQTVRCGPSRSGARCYLCVRGGLAVPRVMDSASTHVMTGVGGRPLRKGDILAIGDKAVRRPRTARTDAPRFEASPTLRVTDGPQAGRFSGELFRGPYTVSEESNRMGLRLRGLAMPSPAGGMLTEGVPLGAIQVPPDGQPIILFVEHQTTGGYPKPANVISADFWRLGQLRPRDQIAFERITIDQALEFMQQQERWLLSI